MTLKDFSRKARSLANSKRRLVLILIVLLLALILQACQTPPKPEPRVQTKVYVADSKTQSIVRGRDVIFCKDERFENRVCMTTREYTAQHFEYTSLISRCEKWRK